MKIWRVIVEVAWEDIEERWYDIIFFEQNKMFLLNELRKRFEFTKLCYVLKFKILKFVATFVLIIFCVHGVLLSKL